MQKCSLKATLKMPLRLLWCNYATFTNFTFQLPKFFAAHNSGAQDSVRGYDWQNATSHEWLSKTGVVFLSNKDCCIPDQMAAQEYWSQKGVDTLSEMLVPLGLTVMAWKFLKSTQIFLLFLKVIISNLMQSQKLIPWSFEVTWVSWSNRITEEQDSNNLLIDQMSNFLW